MSDSKGGKGPDRGLTYAELDGEAIDKFNKNLQISLEREARLHRHNEWRGNKLPPFAIEPMPFERDRLGGAGMTAEDRALRRQWLKDQELSPNEPRYIPELYPKNPIRRMLAAPWNVLFNALRPLIGERWASSGRFFVPKYCIALGTLYAFYYHMKYNPSQWSEKMGWNIFSSKPVFPPEGVDYVLKQDTDFFDKGFKSRKVLLNPKVD